MTLTSPGLPNPLPGENISCHLADSEGRFPPIIVPAFEVMPGTVFSCDIEGLMVPDYPGVTATINLGFQSSLFNEPFDITNQVLTIYRCSAGERYPCTMHTVLKTLKYKLINTTPCMCMNRLSQLLFYVSSWSTLVVSRPSFISDGRTTRPGIDCIWACQ